jgi:hypothetical protein
MIKTILAIFLYQDAKTVVTLSNPDLNQRVRISKLKTNIKLSVLKVLLIWPVLVHRVIKVHLNAPKAAVIVPTVMVLVCVPLGFIPVYLLIGFGLCNYAMLIYLATMDKEVQRLTNQ